MTPIDWPLFHALNTGVATRDWLEDPTTLLAGIAVPLYAVATFGLWFLDRPFAAPRWKLASVSALLAAAMALGANQVISHLWDRPRPFAAHPASTHLLAPPSPDPSFPSDHVAAAFAIAFAVLAFSGRAGGVFLAAATAIGLSRIALGLHYPSDVLAGLLIGFATATITTRLGRPWVAAIVARLSRLSDPLLEPAWDRLSRRWPLHRP